MENVKQNKMADMPMKKLFWKMGLPMIISMVLQALYNVVDSIFVTNMGEQGAIANQALTLAFPIQILIIAIGVGTGIGLNTLLSKNLGENNKEQVNKVAGNGIFISICIFILFFLFGMFGSKWFISLFSAGNEEIISMGTTYLKICCCFSLGSIAYTAYERFLQATGKTNLSAIAQISGAIANIVLDYIFIFPLNMGVTGAAWATVIAQTVSGILCLIYMRKKYSVLKFESDELKIDGYCIRRLCYIGVPMGLQYSITAIGSVILQTAVNGLGSIIVAAVTAAGKISMFLCCPFDALGSTMATYAGQNIGAGKLERISEGIKKSMIIGSVYSIVALIISVFFGKSLALLFVNENEIEILAKVSENLIIIAAFYIPLCIVNVVRFTIQGMGYSTFAILAGVCEMIARALCGFILVPIFGYVAVCLASPVAWIFADAFLIPAYKYVINKSKCEMKIKLVEAKYI